MLEEQLMHIRATVKVGVLCGLISVGLLKSKGESLHARRLDWYSTWLGLEGAAL